MSSSYATSSSRRSHTKSRHGCKTCKKRHIRCDETFPQCRNCSKHQVRCDYLDNQGTSSEVASSFSPSQTSDLYWSQEVETVIDQWQKYGYCMLGNYKCSLTSSGYICSKNDLHLIYQALWSDGPCFSRLSEYTVWTNKVPKFLLAAGNATYFMDALIGFGSLSLAWDRRSQDAKAIAYQHGASALQGVQSSLAQFSQENSDAIFATSILLSWQANDFRAWQSLISGIRTVMSSISHNWQSTTNLGDIIEQMQTELPFSGGFGAYSTQPRDFQLNYENKLQETTLRLSNLKPYLADRREAHDVDQLLDYVARLASIAPAATPEAQFGHLYALRKWLFWIPATILKSSQHDKLTLVFIAHLYTMALAFEPLFPDVAGPFVSAISAEPLENILRFFTEAGPEAFVTSAASPHDIGTLLEWPRRELQAFRTRRSQTQYFQMDPLSSSYDAYNPDFSPATHMFNAMQPSPAFAATPGSRMSFSSSYSSTSGSRGSNFLELPSGTTLPSTSPIMERTYTNTSISSASPSTYESSDVFYTEPPFDFSSAGFVQSPPLLPMWT